MSATCFSFSSQAEEWSFSGSYGPKHWGALNEQYALCDAGKQQSPIDLRPKTAQVDPKGKIHLMYRPARLDVLNTGHSINLIYPRGSRARFNDELYELREIRFRTPSEHTVGGIPYDMEAQFVHENEKGGQVILGVFFEKKDSNPHFDLIRSYFPLRKNERTGPRRVWVNAYNFLPQDKEFVFYVGSETTPPCREGVLWVMMLHPHSIGEEQLARFQELIGGRVRPVQPNHDRHLASQGGEGELGKKGQVQ